MPTSIQRRGGTASAHNTFTGAERELTVNTTNNSVHVHDGSTVGGTELAKADLTNVTGNVGNLVQSGSSTPGSCSIVGDLFYNTTDDQLLICDGSNFQASGVAGDSVKPIYQRSATQPTTPTASATVPTGWYDDTANVPAGSDPIWVSYGTKSSGALNFTWQTPVQLTGEDGSAGAAGDDGLQSASGYLYFDTQTLIGSPPSAPTASTYNFTTGEFGSLTSGWATTITVGTPLEGYAYWAVRYNVEETSGGGESVTLSSVYRWQNFDGLVTFTNIEAGIDDNVTTIDGGNVNLVNLNASNITTGTISSSIVYTGKIDLDDSTVDSGVNVSDPQWGTLSTAFALDSSTNAVGLLCTWSGTANGSAIYGRASAANEGGAVVGVNNSSSTTDLSYGGFFQHTSTTDKSIGVTGVTGSTGSLSAGGNFQSPLGGIGLRVAQGAVEIGPAASGEGGQIRYEPSSGSNYWYTDVDGSNNFRIFLEDSSSPDEEFSLTTAGNLTIRGTYTPFTGSHLALVNSSDTVTLGDIAVDTDEIYKSGVSDTLTRVETSSAAESSRAIGVYATQPTAVQRKVDSQTVETTNLYGDTVSYQSRKTVDGRLVKYGEDQVETFADDNKKVVLVNSVGEGQINVCGEGGDIAAGDLIVTSSTAGKGMKQSDDIVRSKTVAKAREAVTFSSPSEVQQIACIYLCG